MILVLRYHISHDLSSASIYPTPDQSLPYTSAISLNRLIVLLVAAAAGVLFTLTH